jgi:hypothetical protein
MTGADDGLMVVLSWVDPVQADLPPVKGSNRYDSIMAAAMTTVSSHDRRWDPLRGRWVVRRLPRLRLSIAAAAAVFLLAGAISAAMLIAGGPGGIDSIAPALAAEAVKKAAADTAAVDRSGIIDTTLMQDGAVALTRTFSWNGEDLAVKAGGPDQGDPEFRYVDGCFYAKDYFDPYDGQWHHYTDYDNGGGGQPTADGAYAGFVPGQLLSDSRSALVGSGLMDLVSGASGFTRTSSADGGQTFTGTLTIADLVACDLGLSGVPFACQPLVKMSGPGSDKQLQRAGSETPVSIEVTIGPSGLIETATLAYQLEGVSLEYAVTYGQLGSAPAITAPDPDHTTTLDGPDDGVQAPAVW